jgi:uncharacterized protein
MKLLRRLILLSILFVFLLTGFMYWTATRDPVIRRANIAMPDWPQGAPPVKVMLISDVHIAGPDMPPERIARIMNQVNAAKPDLVVFAGDFVSDKALSTKHYPASGLTAPLSRLKAPLGVIAAVPGNHDHWRSMKEVRSALEAAGLKLLANDAVVAGPLLIGGVDDEYTKHHNLPQTLAAMQAEAATAQRPLARLMLSHSPDIVPDLPVKGDGNFTSLILAGHTHCGQIVWPVIGALTHVSRYKDRYGCGIIREEGKTVVVTAGLGTSVLPLRLGAVPDMWLLTLGG